MTSNQIAYASAVEEARHNQAVEQENSRHNVESERLSGELNDISKQKMENENYFNVQSINLKQAQLDWQMQYDQATLDQKEAIAKRQAEIDQQLADLQSWYDKQLVDLQDREVSVKEQQALEQYTHNRMTEWIQSYSASTNAFLTDKKIEYDRYAQLEQNALQILNLDFEREKLDKLIEERATYKLIDTQVEQARLNLQDKAYQLDLIRFGQQAANQKRDLDIKQQNADSQTIKSIGDLFINSAKLGLSLATGGLIK